MKHTKPAEKIDLHDYDSPIKRADGTVPYNGYLWPTESWWPSNDPKLRNKCRGNWHFEVIHLADGRFSIEGTVCQIEANSTTPFLRPGDKPGRPVVFADRAAAIRTSAARMIREIRYARQHPEVGIMSWPVDKQTYGEIVNWTLEQVASALKEEPHRTVTPTAIPDPFKPSGLDLFDQAEVPV